MQGWGSEKELAEKKVWKLFSIEKGTSMSTEVRKYSVADAPLGSVWGTSWRGGADQCCWTITPVTSLLFPGERYVLYETLCRSPIGPRASATVPPEASDNPQCAECERLFRKSMQRPIIPPREGDDERAATRGPEAS